MAALIEQVLDIPLDMASQGRLNLSECSKPLGGLTVYDGGKDDR